MVYESAPAGNATRYEVRTEFRPFNSEISLSEHVLDLTDIQIHNRNTAHRIYRTLITKIFHRIIPRMENSIISGSRVEKRQSRCLELKALKSD